MAAPTQVGRRESCKPSRVDGASGIASLAINDTAFAVTAAIVSNAGGTVTLTFEDGSTALLTLVAGYVYPYYVKKASAGTLADLFGLY